MTAKDKIQKYFALFFVFVFVFSLYFGTAHAGVPKIISFQGRLTNSSGNLLGGTGTDFFFKFAIHNAATGGSQLWPAGAPPAITSKVTQGVFNVLLGDTSLGFSALDLDFDSTPYFLEVMVASSIGGPYETLSPRQQVGASGFAINADTVHGGRFINATGVGQFGGLATVSYSRFGTAVTTHSLSLPSDLLVAGKFEVDSQAFFDSNASISGNFEFGGYASASKTFGSGLTSCSGSSSKLLWDSSTGRFSCGTDAGASGQTIAVGEGLGAFSNASSISFDAGQFNVSFSSPLSTIRLDWTNGPASRSATQAITGNWTFSAASTQFNTLEFGTASSSGNAIFRGTGSSSFAGSLNTTLSFTSAKSITGLTFQGTGAGSSSFAGSLDVSKGIRGVDITSSGRLTVGGQSTFSNGASFSNNLELTSATGRLGINAGNLTNTTLEVGGTASISGATTLGSTLGVTGRADFSSNASISSNLEVTGYASASQTFGSGLTSCSGTTDKLQWNSATGKFSCGIDQASGGGGSIEVREYPGGFDSIVGSLSFEPGNFNLTASGSSDVKIKLDWTNGPASRAASQTITGAWTFTNASNAFTNTLEIGTASISTATIGSLTVTNPSTFGQLNFTNASGSSRLELTSATSRLGINAGGTTDTTLEVGGTASISGATTLGSTLSVTSAITQTGAAASNSFAGSLNTTLGLHSATNVSAGGLFLGLGTGSNSFAGSLNLSKSLNIGTTLIGSGTGSNSFAGSLDVSKGIRGVDLTATGRLTVAGQSSLANASSSGTVEASILKALTLGSDTTLTLSPASARTFITGTASVSSNFEVSGNASASATFGSGLTSCTGATSKLLWNSSTGLFSCGVDMTSSGGSAIGVRESGGSFSNVTSVSFEAGNFDVTFPAGALIKLDWTNGPASRSATQAITGNWTFSAASTQFNTLEFGTASSSGNAIFRGTGSSSFAGSLNASLSLTSAKSITGLTFQGTGAGSNSFAGSLNTTLGLHSATDVSAGGRFLGLGTGSNSFAGSLNLAKGLAVTGGLNVTGNSIFTATTHNGLALFTAGASVSTNFEVTGNNRFGINAGGNTDTTLEVGGTASISSTLTLSGSLSSLFTGSNSFAGSLNISKGLTANSFQGGGLTGCVGSQFLQYSQGQFSCATPSGSSSSAQLGIEIIESGGVFGTHYGSVSFEAGNFNITFPTASSSLVKLDWTNGPASRSATQAITGNWTFSAASTQFNTLEFGTASSSGNAIFRGTGSSSFAGSLNASLSLTSAKSITGLTFQGTGAGSNSFAGSLNTTLGLHSATDVSAGGRFLGLGTGSNSFAGSLNLAKGLAVTGGLNVTGNSIFTATTHNGLALFTAGASVSTNFEVTGNNRFGINAGGNTDTTLEVGGTASISGTLFANGALTVTGALSAVDASISHNLDVSHRISVGVDATANFSSASLTVVGGNGTQLVIGSTGQNTSNSLSFVEAAIGGGTIGGIRAEYDGSNSLGAGRLRFEDFGAGTALFTIDRSGRVGVNSTLPNAAFEVLGVEDAPQTIIQGFTTQNRALTEWKNSSGVTIASISAAGSFDTTGFASASQTFGSGLTTCSGANALQWSSSTGKFTCAAIASGSIKTEASGTSVVGSTTILNFDDGHFNLTASGSSETIIRLDWTNGPASRSATQAITGNWTFSAASTQFNTLEFGTASSSGNAIFRGTGSSSFAGSLNTTLSLTSAKSITGLTFQGTGAGSNSFAGSLNTTLGLHSATDVSAGGRFLGLGTGSNSFAGSLDVLKSLRVTGSIGTTYTGSNSWSGSLALAKGLAVSGGLNVTGNGIFSNALTVSGVFTAADGASFSNRLELTSATARLGINAGGTTDTSLEVGGTASISGKLSLGDSASVSANFEVTGYASASQYFGAGLTDCDSQGDKLIWTASGSSRGKFGCGTDNPKVVKVKQTTQKSNTNSTVFVTDNELKITGISPSETWIFRFDIIASVNTAQDIQFRIKHPGASTGTCKYSLTNYEVGTTTAGDLQTTDTCNTGLLAFGGATSNASPSLALWGQVTTGATVTSAGSTPSVSLEFAENAAVAGTTVSVGRGSMMVAYKVSGADVGEIYYGDNTALLPGTVVSLDASRSAGVTMSRRPYDSEVIGVVSTKPALVMGDTESPVSGVPVIVGLSGRVPVVVSAENGPIRPGDWLTTSSIPGVAMKATRAGPAIGQALTPFTGPGIGTVNLFIKNSQYLGKAPRGENSSDLTSVELLRQLTDGTARTASVSMSEVFADRIIAGLEIVAPAITVQNASVDRISATTGALEVSIGADGAFNIVASGSTEPLLSLDAQGNVLFKGTVTAQGLTGLSGLTGQLADMSAALAQINSYGLDTRTLLAGDLSSLSGRADALSSDLASWSRQFAVQLDELRHASQSLEFSDQVTFNGGLRVDSIGSVGDALAFMNDTVFFGRPYFTTDTAGFAKITQGQTSVQVSFDREYLEQPIVNATITLDDSPDADALTAAIFSGDMRYVVTRKNVHGFTIKLAQPASEDITFSWTALAVKNAKTFESSPSPSPESSVTPDISPSGSPAPESTPEVTPDATPLPSETPAPTPEETPTPTPEEPPVQ